MESSHSDLWQIGVSAGVQAVKAVEDQAGAVKTVAVAAIRKGLVQAVRGLEAEAVEPAVHDVFRVLERVEVARLSIIKQDIFVPPVLCCGLPSSAPGGIPDGRRGEPFRLLLCDADVKGADRLPLHFAPAALISSACVSVSPVIQTTGEAVCALDGGGNAVQAGKAGRDDFGSGLGVVGSVLGVVAGGGLSACWATRSWSWAFSCSTVESSSSRVEILALSCSASLACCRTRSSRAAAPASARFSLSCRRAISARSCSVLVGLAAAAWVK